MRLPAGRAEPSYCKCLGSSTWLHKRNWKACRCMRAGALAAKQRTDRRSQPAEPAGKGGRFGWHDRVGLTIVRARAHGDGWRAPRHFQRLVILIIVAVSTRHERIKLAGDPVHRIRDDVDLLVGVRPDATAAVEAVGELDGVRLSAVRFAAESPIGLLPVRRGAFKGLRVRGGDEGSSQRSGDEQARADRSHPRRSGLRSILSARLPSLGFRPSVYD
jgi:hypothetical protein